MGKGKYSRYKTRLEAFLASENGKRFFNFAYSWGASVVVAGALFKILHWPGANVMLTIGMGVEVVMFFISAFDYPTSIPSIEEVLPSLKARQEGEVNENHFVGNPTQQVVPQRVSYPTNGSDVSASPSFARGNQNASVENVVGGCEKLSDNMKSFSNMAGAISELSQEFQSTCEVLRQRGANGKDPSKEYVTQMDALNKNLSGLNTIYEIQLRSISSQISTIEQINSKLSAIKEMYDHSTTNYCEESEKMTKLMASLNEVYVRMLEAMKVSSRSGSENVG